MRLILILLLLGFSTSTIAQIPQRLQSMSYYQAHPKISKTAKNFQKKLSQYQKNSSIYFADSKMEMTTASIHDSVFTKNDQTRPFYFYLMNRNMDLADGSILLGTMINQFKIIEKKPAYFFRYMLDNSTEKKNYFSKWANNMTTFADQYCRGFLNMDMDINTDSCMSIWTRSVMKLLSNEPVGIKSMANEFFTLMKIPGEELRPPIDDSKDHLEPPKTISIGKADNGKTFRVSLGTNIEAKFRECRGCAQIWKVAGIDGKKIMLLDEGFSNPSCTNCVGGNQDHTFFLKAAWTGKTTLVFTYFEERVTVYIEVN